MQQRTPLISRYPFFRSLMGNCWWPQRQRLLILDIVCSRWRGRGGTWGTLGSAGRTADTAAAGAAAGQHQSQHQCQHQCQPLCQCKLSTPSIRVNIGGIVRSECGPGLSRSSSRGSVVTFSSLQPSLAMPDTKMFRSLQCFMLRHVTFHVMSCHVMS